MPACALVGASEFNSGQFLEMHAKGAFDCIVAVDGGLASLEAVGVKPDLAIGDFDSLGYVPKGMRVVRFPPEKAKSDMELALDKARSLKYNSAVIFGALGGRLDHTLANLQLFSKFSEAGMDICAIDLESAIFFITGPDTFEAPAQDCGTVSVFAMNDICEGVFERGLKWELDDVSLSGRTSLGLSNELMGEAVLIGVEKGTLAIFYPL